LPHDAPRRALWRPGPPGGPDAPPSPRCAPQGHTGARGGEIPCYRIGAPVGRLGRRGGISRGLRGCSDGRDRRGRCVPPGVPRRGGICAYDRHRGGRGWSDLPQDGDVLPGGVAGDVAGVPLGTVMLECTARIATVLRGTPSWARREQKAWRRSWNRSPGNPSRFAAFPNLMLTIRGPWCRRRIAISRKIRSPRGCHRGVSPGGVSRGCLPGVSPGGVSRGLLRLYSPNDNRGRVPNREKPCPPPPCLPTRAHRSPAGLRVPAWSVSFVTLRQKAGRKAGTLDGQATTRGQPYSTRWACIAEVRQGSLFQKECHRPTPFPSFHRERRGSSLRPSRRRGPSTPSRTRNSPPRAPRT